MMAYFSNVSASLPRRAGALVLAVGFAMLLIAGCGSAREAATARYDQIQDETVYRARGINLGTMFPTGGMSRDPSVRLNSWARCAGENCRAERAWISFVLQGDQRSRVVSSRDVTIRTDDNVHEWPEQRQRAGESMNAGTELTRIRMEMSTLRDIAQSQSVSGTIGSEDFSISYEDRAPLRALVDQATGNAAPSEDPS